MLVALMTACTNTDKIKTLIITGQGEDNLVWTQAVQSILDASELFSTKIVTTPPEGQDMSQFNPDFSKYDLVVIDYEGDAWLEKSVASLKEFVENGGGVVRVHSKSQAGSPVPSSVSFSERHNFEVRTRITDHPVTNGLPVRWLHPEDVIVQGMDFSADGIQVLATAFSDTAYAGSGKPEPVLLANNSGKGRVFTTFLGTPDLDKNEALECAGFIVTLQRGAEWAATGAVTQDVPFDFPTAAGAVLRTGFKSVNPDEAFENMCSYEIGESTLYFSWLQSEIRRASGNAETLLNLEKKMVEVLKNSKSTVDAKKLILKELSWMGSEYCIPAVKELSSVTDIKDEVDFTLERLQ